MRRLSVMLSFAFALVAQAPATWVSVRPSATSASFRGLQTSGNRTILASGTKGTVAESTDAGAHWKILTIPGAEKLDLRGIQGCGKGCLMVISSGPADDGAAKVFRSEDDGLHWRTVWSTTEKGVFLDAIQIVHDLGYILGDPVKDEFFLLRTRDGGKSWQQMKPAKMPRVLPGEGAFAASNSSLSLDCGDPRGICFATGGGEKSRLFRSNDNGNTWNAFPTPIPAGKLSAGIFAISFHGNEGVAAGGDYQQQNKADKNVAFTSDGGRTWTVAPFNFEYRSGVFYDVNERTVVAVGPTGSEISNDSGKSWRNIGGEQHWNAVAGSACGKFAAAGPDGRIAILKDSGVQFCF